VADVLKPLRFEPAELQKQIDELAAISEAAPPVVTRILFSDADRQGRDYVRAVCRNLALSVREDAVGNMFARWEGTDKSLPPIATGSHIDAIPNAGRYDGVVGVLGALEAFRALKAVGFTPRRSIELIIFTAEEPTRFGIGCLGSRLLAKALSIDQAERLKDRDGVSLQEWRRRTGLDKEPLDSVPLARNSYSAFIELHIEQGPILEKENIPIGVVEKIAAPSTLQLELTGVGGHAGAVLMPERHDALLAGAEIALAVERAVLATGCPDTVGTTGVFRIEPGAVNSVPCKARLEIDVRDTDLKTRDAALNQIENAAPDICQKRGVKLQMTRLNADAPATCDPHLVNAVMEAGRALGLPVKKMISRAYHDSLFMAQICPTTMIFIPCRDGVSHRPDEYSSPEQIAKGVTVLATVLQRLSS
jgi:ureidoglycolate amidohydrolase